LDSLVIDDIDDDMESPPHLSTVRVPHLLSSGVSTVCPMLTPQSTHSLWAHRVIEQPYDPLCSCSDQMTKRWSMNSAGHGRNRFTVSHLPAQFGAEDFQICCRIFCVSPSAEWRWPQ